MRVGRTVCPEMVVAVPRPWLGSPGKESGVCEQSEASCESMHRGYNWADQYHTQKGCIPFEATRSILSSIHDHMAGANYANTRLRYSYA